MARITAALAATLAAAAVATAVGGSGCRRAPSTSGASSRSSQQQAPRGSATSSGVGSADLGASAPAAGAGEAGVPGKLLRIALIAKSSSNPSFLSAKTGAEDQARELSGKWGLPIDIKWMTPSQEDGRLQAQRILQAVNERFDAILISCLDDARVVEAIDDAVARGVAVMTFDSDAPTSRRFSYCGVDDELIGRSVMIELSALLPPKAQIAVLAGNRDAPSVRRRIEGFMREAAAHPGLEVVGTFGHLETAQDAAAELLRVQTAYPRVTGWAVMGGWPLYTKALLAELQPGSGKSRHRIVSVNALPPQLVYVERGVAPVLLAQPTYLWGAVGVQTIVDKLVLKKDVPEIVPLDLVRVTADNLGAWARQLRAWGFGDVPDEYLKMK